MSCTDRISYQPGDEALLHVSSSAPLWRGRLEALDIPSAGVVRRQREVPAAEPVSAPGIAQETAAGSYVRVDRMPAPTAAGLTVALAICPTRPGARDLGPQIALAHAHDGAGWWVGVGADGRALVGVSTAAGPISLSAGRPLAPGQWVEFVARIPGRPGDRLTLDVRPAGTFASNVVVDDTAEPASASVVVGSPLVPSPGPLTWGCRTLRDLWIPEHAFDGRVENPVVVADATAAGTRAELASHLAVVAAWDLAADIGPEGIAGTRRVTDAGPGGRHGVAHQHPHRLVTSSG